MSATYAMYPEYHNRPHESHEMREWGPARNDPEHPSSKARLTAALQAALDLRDNGGQRPDDN